MDHGSFDRFTRLLGRAGSRRAALGALVGSSLAGTLGMAEAAKKKDRGNKRGKGNAKQSKGSADVSAQAADCSSPGPSSNMSDCNFDGQTFSGDNLSSSRMVETLFRNAELVGTNLSSSNMKDADFRGANLCGANLRSSTLKNADFRGFAPLQGSGRQTNLTLADLRSSGGCNSIDTNSRTIFCGTRMCDGSVRNDNCMGGPASNFCCTPCAVGEVCIDNECVAVCDEPFFSSLECPCLPQVGGGVACTQAAECNVPCSLAGPACPAGQVCATTPCCASAPGAGFCFPLCGDPAACTCDGTPTPAECVGPAFVRCGTGSASARRANRSASAAPWSLPTP